MTGAGARFDRAPSEIAVAIGEGPCQHAIFALSKKQTRRCVPVSIRRTPKGRRALRRSSAFSVMNVFSTPAVQDHQRIFGF
jgi:hypothetical protein